MNRNTCLFHSNYQDINIDQIVTFKTILDSENDIFFLYYIQDVDESFFVKMKLSLDKALI